MTAGRDSRPLAGLRDLLGRPYDTFRLARGEWAARRAEYAEGLILYSNERLSVGAHTYGQPKIATFPGDTASVRIGAFGSIGPEVVLMDGGNHRTDWVTTFPLRARFGLPGAYEDGHPSTKGDIVIGNDVWIGRGARVQSGVSIGDGAVIAGYSIVTRDVRPYAIVAGNPAREIRRRFGDHQVEALLRIAWWDWPVDRVLAEVDQLSSDRVDAFIGRHLPDASPGERS